MFMTLENQARCVTDYTTMIVQNAGSTKLMAEYCTFQSYIATYNSEWKLSQSYEAPMPTYVESSNMALTGTWENQHKIESKRYICGHCGSDITTDRGFRCLEGSSITSLIYVCHHCNRPTFFWENQQIPGAKVGGSVEHLPKDIDDIYAEIRDATAANAYTAAVMAARKLLMHIAVECGDEPGKTFAQYIDYLETNHHTPPNSKVWVDRIRTLGNEANHEITIMGTQEATNIIKFIEMLLKFIYEFPNSIAEDESGGEDGVN